MSIAYLAQGVRTGKLVREHRDVYFRHQVNLKAGCFYGQY